MYGRNNLNIESSKGIFCFKFRYIFQVYIFGGNKFESQNQGLVEIIHNIDLYEKTFTSL